MPTPTSPSGFALLVDPYAGGKGVQAGIELSLRRAIEGGRLGSGTPIPSSRTLANDLGVARGTVVAAYESLVAGGWLTARRGAGTVVSDAASRVTRPSVPDISVVEGEVPPWDLRPGRPERGSFPKSAWVSSLRSALDSAPDYALDYGDPRGVPELREAIAAYLARVRGLSVDKRNVVVCAGGRLALTVEFSCLREMGASRIGFEDPGAPLSRALATAAGFTVERLEADGDGARIDEFGRESSSPSVVMVMPAHPLRGAGLTLKRRHEFVAWARESESFICEDDYAGEFRIDRVPLPALQTLDPSRVVYGGSTSKVLAPGLRIAWLVVPDSMLDLVLDQRRLVGGQCASIDQLTLAEFMRNGRYDRHLRTMRQRYSRRLVTLRAMLKREVPWALVSGLDSGIHIVIDLPRNGPTERDVLERARALGLAIEGLNTHGYTHEDEPDRQAIVVGFATPPEHGFVMTIKRLIDALNESLRAVPAKQRAVSGFSGVN